jgi:hypothetical protein
MEEPTREEIGDLLRRLVDTAVEMKERAEAAEQALATARADALREVRDSAVLPQFAGEGLNGFIDYLLDSPNPAPTPSPDDLVKFALGHAVGLCCPHEDDDDKVRKARQECADAIAFASIVPDTIAEIIAKAKGKKDKSRA